MAMRRNVHLWGSTHINEHGMVSAFIYCLRLLMLNYLCRRFSYLVDSAISTRRTEHYLLCLSKTQVDTAKDTKTYFSGPAGL
jgi:hypothetical protein